MYWWWKSNHDDYNSLCILGDGPHSITKWNVLLLLHTCPLVCRRWCGQIQSRNCWDFPRARLQYARWFPGGFLERIYTKFKLRIDKLNSHYPVDWRKWYCIRFQHPLRYCCQPHWAEFHPCATKRAVNYWLDYYWNFQICEVPGDSIFYLIC